MTSKPPVHVEIALPVVRKLKRLVKKYPHSFDDLQGLIRQLESGQMPGDQISGAKYTAYKVRVRNTDVPKGKSGGYRVIYYIRTADNVVIIMMYTKSERADVDADEIRRIIDNL